MRYLRKYSADAMAEWLRRSTTETRHSFVVGGKEVLATFYFSFFEFGEKNFFAKLHVSNARGKDLK